MRPRHQAKLLAVAFLFALVGVAFFGAYSGIKYAGYQEPDRRCDEINYFCAFWLWISHDAAGLFTALLCGITVFLAYYTYGLLRATIDLATDANESATKQFELAKDTARRQLRAYVVVSRVRAYSVAPNQQIVIKPKKMQRLTMGQQAVAAIQVRNAGQTPAHNVKTHLNAMITPWPLDESKLILPEWEAGSINALGQNETRMSQAVIHPAQHLTLAQIMSLENGSFAFVVFGRITYEDIFGNEWRTDLRFFTGGAIPIQFLGTRMSAHDRGNDAT